MCTLTSSHCLRHVWHTFSDLNSSLLSEQLVQPELRFICPHATLELCLFLVVSNLSFLVVFLYNRCCEHSLLFCRLAGIFMSLRSPVCSIFFSDYIKLLVWLFLLIPLMDFFLFAGCCISLGLRASSWLSRQTEVSRGSRKMKKRWLLRLCGQRWCRGQVIVRFYYSKMKPVCIFPLVSSWHNKCCWAEGAACTYFIYLFASAWPYVTIGPTLTRGLT